MIRRGGYKATIRNSSVLTLTCGPSFGDDVFLSEAFIGFSGPLLNLLVSSIYLDGLG